MSLLLVNEQLPTDYQLELCHQFGLTAVTQAQGWHLAWHDNALVLRDSNLPKQGDIWVDFTSGRASHRRLYGGGKGEAIAKAVGLNKRSTLTVLDATAGLGRDSFVMASIGATVLMVERQPMVAALLYDGLRRAKLDSDLAAWLPQRLQLLHTNAVQALTEQALTEQALSKQGAVDVVYLDPMFPAREKSALVKKEMRAFHHVVGDDNDADALLPLARALAIKRVVVKRPVNAEFLANTAPTMSLTGKSNRFDVYVNAAI
ncbi:class I SAM-dependent methyltransferase [Rheinheimera salexigens]|uniref:Ribosomal RNA small subunit methyltransferase J n=1 Tax=Rheinheimera salexigens TaxID=1628148 RepID=A0A1E7Q3Z8_9GAMM|nr:class I SAM-dependent methyltransferase [Rheinheimera salexigens]OEY68803.1 DNA polymerase I [Rheinheimera salexigens]